MEEKGNSLKVKSTGIIKKNNDEFLRLFFIFFILAEKEAIKYKSHLLTSLLNGFYFNALYTATWILSITTNKFIFEKKSIIYIKPQVTYNTLKSITLFNTIFNIE